MCGASQAAVEGLGLLQLRLLLLLYRAVVWVEGLAMFVLRRRLLFLLRRRRGREGYLCFWRSLLGLVRHQEHLEVE
jgi:hypothetical protein